MSNGNGKLGRVRPLENPDDKQTRDWTTVQPAHKTVKDAVTAVWALANDSHYLDAEAFLRAFIKDKLIMHGLDVGEWP